MGDKNPIRTLGDYFRPSHEGYQNTIKLPDGNNWCLCAPTPSGWFKTNAHSTDFEDLGMWAEGERHVWRTRSVRGWDVRSDWGGRDVHTVVFRTVKQPKVVKKNDDAPIIEEWVSDDEEEDVSQPKIEKKIVRPSIVKKEHMTWNMSYLTNYEEIDGGYVAFGGNPKGGKIIGKGSGPDWLFDIDALTRTMNYEPIVAGTQSNGFAGTKSSDNAGQARKETKPVKDYILLPLWTVDMERKDDKIPRKDSECKDQEKEDNVNNTNNVNTEEPKKALNRISGIKKDERGIMIRNKARLVAQGYTQEKGIDYDEVFALVARIEAIRLFLAYASFKDFVVYQMDVKSAFLYGKIEKEVYVCQPPRFEDP
ncbi:retrovirus-related pol polyprotein from transposon TNT 1-94 [Tanacetum coccineum]